MCEPTDTQMECMSVWAPPEVCLESLCNKVNEWMRLNPSKPPYERFIQDYVSSQWPVMWHLKIEYKVLVDKHERIAMSDETETITDERPLCAICHNELCGSVEHLACRHAFHTMCIHTWLRRADTCPMCRAPI